jgi:hypothetical protein
MSHKMDAPNLIEPPRKSIKTSVWSLVALILILASLFVTASLLFGIRQTLYQFYLDTAALAPGTGIRPMGMEMLVGIAWTASILIGDVCALVGGIISIKQRRWSLVAVAILAGIIAWVPMFYTQWEIDHIVTLRKLVMEP